MLFRFAVNVGGDRIDGLPQVVSRHTDGTEIAADAGWFGRHRQNGNNK